MNLIKVFTIVSAVCFLTISTARATSPHYAKVTATGTGNGLSWANATTLSQAITDASSGEEVWVKAGTYGPITLKNGVKIYGGFAGTESSASQSDPSANQTVIDGGGTSRAIYSENDASSTVLRGFRITDGYNNNIGEGGGGLLLINSSVIIVQCVFDHNRATHWGAAITNRGNSSPHIINCIFNDNGLRPYPGQPIGEYNGESNYDTMGGGAVLVYTGSPTFVNCLFYNNKAGAGGAIAVIDGTPTLINCTITGNESTIEYGGGIYDQEGKATVRNTIVWNNSSEQTGPSGAQIFNKTGVETAVDKSDVQGGWNGTGNINSDPLFVNVSTNDYKLQSSSPCKNKGRNLTLPADIGDVDWDNNTTEQISKDLTLGLRRVMIVDMGAYEIQAGGGGS